MRAWTAAVLMCACGSHGAPFTTFDSGTTDPGEHGDGGVGFGTSDAGPGWTGGGGGTPPPELCPAPVAPVDTTAPTTVVSPCTESSLRDAVAAGGIVTFGCSSAIHVTSEIVVSTDTVIDARGVVLAGSASSRVFHVTNGAHLTVQNGMFASGGVSYAGDGAAIFADGASLTVIDSSFAHAKASGAGGFIATTGPGSLVVSHATFDDGSADLGGAIAARGTDAVIANVRVSQAAAKTGGAIAVTNAAATLCGVVITTVKATASGGGLYFAGGPGGSLVSLDRVNIDASGIDLFTGDGAGAYFSGAQLSMKRTTITHVIGHMGACAYIADSTFALENVTLYGSEAYRGGGLWVTNASGTILNSTIAMNQGGGIAGGGPSISIDDSIVANNTKNLYDGTVGCDATLSSTKPTLEWPLGPTPCTASGIVADPLLGGLEDNGGNVRTARPSSGSPAIGAGVDCATIDALGHARPSACTLGAVEP